MTDKATQAAPTDAPESDRLGAGADGGDGRSVVAGGHAGGAVAGHHGGRSDEDIKAEQEAVRQKPLGGPGSGSRLVTGDGEGISSLKDFHDKDGETIVTIKGDVYEEFPAPGAPNRKIKRLVFHAGQKVPSSVLKRHEDALKANKDEVARLEKLGRGTGHPQDADLAGDGETKEGGSGAAETKEGGRGRVSRRS